MPPQDELHWQEVSCIARVRLRYIITTRPVSHKKVPLSAQTPARSVLFTAFIASGQSVAFHDIHWKFSTPIAEAKTRPALVLGDESTNGSGHRSQYPQPFCSALIKTKSSRGHAVRNVHIVSVLLSPLFLPTSFSPLFSSQEHLTAHTLLTIRPSSTALVPETGTQTC